MRVPGTRTRRRSGIGNGNGAATTADGYFMKAAKAMKLNSLHACRQSPSL